MDKRYAIGNFICELRQEKGFTQKELGELMGVTNKAVSKWENGASLPRAEELAKLSVILGCSIEELLKGRRLEDEDSTGEHNETEPISKPRELTEEERRIRELYAPYDPNRKTDMYDSTVGDSSIAGARFPGAYRGIGNIIKSAILGAAGSLLAVIVLIADEWGVVFRLAALGCEIACIPLFISGIVSASRDEREFKKVWIWFIFDAVVTIIVMLFNRGGDGTDIAVSISSLISIGIYACIIRAIGSLMVFIDYSMIKRGKAVLGIVVGLSIAAAGIGLVPLFVRYSRYMIENGVVFSSMYSGVFIEAGSDKAQEAYELYNRVVLISAAAEAAVVIVLKALFLCYLNRVKKRLKE